MKRLIARLAALSLLSACARPPHRGRGGTMAEYKEQMQRMVRSMTGGK